MVHRQENGFRQITQEERVEIYVWLGEWLSYREIWRRMERSHSSISREIERNGIDYGWWKVVYKALEAEKKKVERKQQANRSHIKLRKDVKLREKIHWMLHTTDWWPDEVIWRLKHEWWKVVATSTVYRYIHTYARWWKRYLLHKWWWYRKKYTKKQGIRYEDIAYCDTREGVREDEWHTENDSVECGSGKWWLTVSIFRHSRYYQARKVSSLCGKETYRAMRNMLQGHKVVSITIDNGSEFSEVRKFKEARLYRCHAYSSREKWSIERHNWLLRRYIPKRTNIGELSDAEIEKVTTALNHKPRKILGYRTPYEVQYSQNLSYTS
jgi:transposase, IS30 family